MPIYEYECNECGHHCEKLQKISDEPLRDCLECKKPALRKLISLSGFQLKGTGWYATDYAKKGKSDQSKTDVKSSDNKSDKSSGGKDGEGSGGSSSDSN